MLYKRLLILCLPLALAATALGQTTQPTLPGPTVEFEANQAFSRGQYAAALPLLQKLAGQLKDSPDRLGPVEEQIRFCQKNLDPKALAAATPAPAASPFAATPPAALSDRRTPHPVPKPGEILTMTIKDLGNFDYDADKGGNIPADVKALSGAHIRLSGFMIPMDQAESITQFALVPSLFACCFGQPPQIQHTIVVTCPKGKAVSYFPDEIQVDGTLSVEEKKDDGFIVSVFQMSAASVKPAAK